MSIKKPPLLRRLGAYLADWFVGDLFAAFPVAIAYAMITQKTEVTSSILDVPGNGALPAGVLSLGMILLYYVLIPWKVWRGQTIGKRLCGVRIVRQDGENPGFGCLLVRQAAGLLILENSLMSAGSYLADMVTLFAGGQAAAPLGWWRTLGIATGIISIILVVFTPSGRALHDYLAGTRATAAGDER